MEGQVVYYYCVMCGGKISNAPGMKLKVKLGGKVGYVHKLCRTKQQTRKYTARSEAINFNTSDLNHSPTCWRCGKKSQRGLWSRIGKRSRYTCRLCMGAENRGKMLMQEYAKSKHVFMGPSARPVYDTLVVTTGALTDV